MALSSLMPEDDPWGINGGGGGEALPPPPVLLHSEYVSQNDLDLFFSICCLKLLDSPVDRSRIRSSSGSSIVSWLTMLGEDRALTAWDRSNALVAGRVSCSTSLSRTCLTTSASRRNSVSAGALSSSSAARMRAKVFVFGCSRLASVQIDTQRL